MILNTDKRPSVLQLKLTAKHQSTTESKCPLRTCSIPALHVMYSVFLNTKRTTRNTYEHRMAPFVPDDLLLEILLRLPPRPSCLLRASLVCKRWRVPSSPTLPSSAGFATTTGRSSSASSSTTHPCASASSPSATQPIASPTRASAARISLPWHVRDSRRGLVLLCDAARRCFLVLLCLSSRSSNRGTHLEFTATT